MRTREVVPEIIYAISHHIGEPMQDVVDRAQLLAQHAPRDADPRYWEDLGRLEASAARTRAMLETICRYLQVGGVPETVDRVDFEAVMNDAIRATRTVRDAHPTTVDAAVSGSVRTYGLLLRDALIELITNAARHGAGDSGEAMVSIRLLTGDDALHVEVSDAGPGIPTDIRERALNLFQSVQPSGTDSLGAGLPVLRRRAEAVGGTLKLSEPVGGTGLRVTLTLPLLAAATPPASADEAIPTGGAA